MCGGLLLTLVAVHSSGNPLPARVSRSLNTTTENEAILQVVNGIDISRYLIVENQRLVRIELESGE